MSDSSLTSSLGITSLPQDGRNWSESQRVKALAVFAETNNVSAAARISGVNRSTIWYWLQDDETLEVVQRIRDSLRAHTAWHHVEIAMAAAAVVKDRLENGEDVIAKNGTIRKKQVSLRDAVMAMAVSTDKSILLSGVMAEAKHTNGQLDALAEALMAKVQSKLSKDNASANDSPGSAASFDPGTYLG